jgi:hypothetical protein
MENQINKQETLEEFIKDVLQDEFFTNIAEYKKAERLIQIGAKWQAEQLFKDDVIQTLEKGIALLLKKQERMYGEEEVLDIQEEWGIFNETQDSFNGKDDLTFKEWFEQFKKK